MTQLLIRLFIKHPSDTKDPAVRTAYGNLASLVGMACNILLCVGKLTVGTLFGSIAIMADALNNLSDASSNVVSLIGFRLASKAPDAEHPYGHAFRWAKSPSAKSCTPRRSFSAGSALGCWPFPSPSSSG